MKLTYQIALLICIGSMLFSSCSSYESAPIDSVARDLDNTVSTKRGTVSETLKTFEDITFSLDKSEGYNAALYFSTELGKSFKTSEIDATILSKIDVAFHSDYSINYFISPNNEDYGIEGAPLTLFINVQEDLLTIEQFNKIENGPDFDKIKIDTDDDESSPNSDDAPRVVLFKNTAGKKGAIYIKSIHTLGYDPRIVVDIKIQK